ncbi:MAG: M23 family metallopeptidase [Vampirovibrionales bacterium]
MTTTLYYTQSKNPFAINELGNQVPLSSALALPLELQTLLAQVKQQQITTQHSFKKLNPILCFLLHIRNGGFRLVQKVVLTCLIPLILGSTQVYAMKVNPSLPSTHQHAMVAQRLQHALANAPIAINPKAVVTPSPSTVSNTLHLLPEETLSKEQTPVLDAFDGTLFEEDERFDQQASESIQAVVTSLRQGLEHQQQATEAVASSWHEAHETHNTHHEHHGHWHAGDALPQGFRHPLKHLKITSPFGKRWGWMHQGTDFAGKVGTSILAAKAGNVVFAGWQGGYGKLVIVDHGGGETTRYGHCSSMEVSVGQYVQQGQTIAKVGSTGHSTGPHLHFEIRHNDVAVNPMNELG